MVLFSATLFPEIKKMAKRYADDYEEIIVGNPTSVARSVEHIVVKLDEEEKYDALKYLIDHSPGKMMVFFNTINQTTRIAQRLKRQGFSNVEYIHSKVDQAGRESIIDEFRGEKIKVLLASDVAARGIDIPNVEIVVNYDLPYNCEDYIHRVGRTGRAGKPGSAYSFYSDQEKKKLAAIEKLIKVKIERRDK
jgi:superfamily II DNA/RNA helicase